jgi:preprotein translocase subunit SecE
VSDATRLLLVVLAMPLTSIVFAWGINALLGKLIGR